MKKVVFLSAVHAFDDTRILHKEARSLAANGYAVTHLCPRTDDTANLFPDGTTEIAGVRIRFYSSGSGWAARPLGFLRTLAAAFSERADIYHCNEPEAWVAACFLKVLGRRRIKIIFDVHEHYPSRFDEPHVPTWVSLVGKPLMRAGIHFLPRITDHIILAKRSVAADFQNFSDKCTCIFNYSPRYILDIDDSGDDPFAGRKRAGEVVFIHVGGFSRQRGWPQILEAMALAGNRKVALIALGRVAEGEEAFYARAEELGVRARVEILPAVEYEEMFRYLRNADVGLMLYQPGILNHVYAFPMKLYDYMAAAIPVVGPDFAVEVVPVVEEAGCGRLVDTSDSAALAHCLDWFCSHPEERRFMGLRGREAVEVRYSWEKEADKLLAVYSGLD